MNHRQYGVTKECVTMGMVRANIASVKETGVGINVFVRAARVPCSTCGDLFVASEASDHIHCARHRERA